MGTPLVALPADAQGRWQEAGSHLVPSFVRSSLRGHVH